jgi:hypothetical protein
VVVAALQEEWSRVLLDMLRNLTSSMPTRVAAVVKAKGRHTLLINLSLFKIDIDKIKRFSIHLVYFFIPFALGPIDKMGCGKKFSFCVVIVVAGKITKTCGGVMYKEGEKTTDKQRDIRSRITVTALLIFIYL